MQFLCKAAPRAGHGKGWADRPEDICPKGRGLRRAIKDGPAKPGVLQQRRCGDVFQYAGFVHILLPLLHQLSEDIGAGLGLIVDFARIDIQIV